jgi:hypothetical protein
LIGASNSGSTFAAYAIATRQTMRLTHLALAERANIPLAEDVPQILRAA